MTRFLILAVLLGGGAFASEPARADDGKFQLMKATENRVWRLNKETGEIAVCTLEGERLLCTTSSEAAMPPKKSYAEMKAEKDAAEKAAHERRRKQDEMEMKILDRILAFFRELITMSKEQSAAK
jgi:hypothetical protein